MKQYPSLIVFFSPYLILELVLMLLFIYFLPHLSSDSSWNFILLFIIWVIFVTIIIVLFLDIFGKSRCFIIGDLCASVSYDFFEKSAVYGEDFMYYEQLMAYDRCLFNDNSICRLCANNYIHHNDKSIIACGHLFHKQCLNLNERYEWDHDINQYPESQCAHCRDYYHAHCQKWDYHENYFKTIPCYLRPYDYFGKDTIHSLFWDIIDQGYKTYLNEEDISQRERFLPRNTKIISDIILDTDFLLSHDE